jgi:cytidylate kinase
MDRLTYDLLQLQDALTSNAIISTLNSNEAFLALSEFEGKLIRQRDDEDGFKLDAGIAIGIGRGSIPSEHDAEPYRDIDVLGKTPEEVASIIMQDVGDAVNTGALIVLCGLSGTGKGTTASILSKTVPGCITWSNGNIFRSITLLAATWCEQNGITEFDALRALSDDNIRLFMTMLSFEKVNSKWEVVINGLGLNTTVSQIENTELKKPMVAKNIPTVAQQTQGEVINFARDSLLKLKADGKVILLEGRQQTVNYIPTPFRYVLILSDESLVGKRRAAQRLAAATLSETKKILIVSNSTDPDTADSYQVNHDELVNRVLLEQLDTLVNESNLHK